MIERACRRGLYWRALALLVPAALPCIVLAQEAGDTVVLSGGLHIHPLDPGGTIATHIESSLATAALGIPQRFESSGTSLSAEDTDTLALSVAHYLTDHIALELDAGVPPLVKVSGGGSVAPPGPAGLLFNLDLGDPDLNPIGSARQWSPALLAQYRFRDPSQALRPFVAAGATYTWFTQLRLHRAFAAALDQRIGRPLASAAGKPGPTTSDPDFNAALAPVFVAGAELALDEHWGLSGSLVFVPFSSTATVHIRAQDGSLLATNRSRVNVDALISGLLLSYRF